MCAVDSLWIRDLEGDQQCEVEDEKGIYCGRDGSARRRKASLYGLETKRVERCEAIRGERCLTSISC